MFLRGSDFIHELKLAAHCPCRALPPICLRPGICRNLKSIVVQIGIADYFKEPSSPEAQKLFEDMVTKLQVRWALRPQKTLWLGLVRVAVLCLPSTKEELT